MHLILASTSPQRKALFSLLALPFEVVEPAWTEPIDPCLSPREVCRRHAIQKARSIAARFSSSLIIGGDTVIEVDGRTLGKPSHRDAARDMLIQLRGRSHNVHTGMALIHHAQQIEVSFLDTATVWMRPLTNEDIDAYLETGESMGSAGSYCIQGEGATLISRIVGDYTTVVGLPLRKLVDYLEDLGLEPPIDIDTLYRDRPYPNWARFPPRESPTGEAAASSAPRRRAT